MTVHITWERVLAFIGVGALSVAFFWLLYGAVTLWLYSRGMKGK